MKIAAVASFCLLAAAAAGAAEPKSAQKPSAELQLTDTSAWYPFSFPLDDTNLDTINLTHLLDPPAGKHGFVTVRPDGHFYFTDGTRARFFGTNICGAAAFPEKEKARSIAARLAKYGVNLLRIHAVDSPAGSLIDYSRPDSRHLNEAALDRLDFFVAELKSRGIYVYLDNLDYRQFKEADGVPDAAQFQRGWFHSIKGASCFNDRLIELQKEFATNFFTHYNPYTKLRYVDDPAVAVVEITNENSVFYFHMADLTLPGYVEELQRRWNQWLVRQCVNREGLSKAWTNGKGQCALSPEEDPERGTVVLPLQHLYQKPEEADYVGARSPARVNAMVRFLFEIERSYYDQMRGHLKQIGVKVPITGTNQTFCPASNFADAANDFMSRNNYWCHPNVRAKPIFTFQNRALVNSEIPKTSNPIVEVASSSAAGKPMIVPEFNFPWPNEYRAEGLLLVTAYACLQDWDGLLFFAYQPEHQMLEFFGNQSDPVRWGEFAAAALLFHRQDVSPARNTVHVGYSQTDIFSARPSHGRDAFSPYRYLAYISKVRNCYFEAVYQGDADVAVASGYSPMASYAQARRAIVFAKNPWTDWMRQIPSRGLIASPLAHGLSFREHSGSMPFSFRGFLLKDRVVELSADTLVTASLPPGAEPLGTTAGGQECLGFINDRFCVVPDAPALGKVDPLWDYRLFAEAAKKWGLLHYDDFEALEQKYTSDTGQLVLDRRRGVFTMITPRSKAALGFLGQAAALDLEGLTLRCTTPFAAVVVSSLDGKPLSQSRRVLVTAVARAENTGQAFSPDKRSLPKAGRPPVLAEPVHCELTMKIAGAATVYALDEAGKRRNRIDAAGQGDTLRLDLSRAKSPWCEIVAEHRQPED